MLVVMPVEGPRKSSSLIYMPLMSPATFAD